MEAGDWLIEVLKIAPVGGLLSVGFVILFTSFREQRATSAISTDTHTKQIASYEKLLADVRRASAQQVEALNSAFAVERAHATKRSNEWDAERSRAEATIEELRRIIAQREEEISALQTRSS